MSASALAARAEPVGWDVQETVSPLTGAKTLSARTASSTPLLNQIDQPGEAALVLRCQEGVRAAYVVWPQVLQAPFHSLLLNLPEAMVQRKLDDGPITTDFWVVSSAGTSAGSFDNAGAPKIMANLHGAKRLVVRMQGLVQQDAVFDITGVDQVIERVEATCGGKLVAAVSPSVVVSPAVSGPSPRLGADAGAAALRAEGFASVTSEEGLASAPLQPFKLTPQTADCGRMFGIPFLADRRVQTQVAAAVSSKEGQASVTLTITAVMKTGMGAPDKPLRCTSTGVLERQVLARLASPGS